MGNSILFQETLTKYDNIILHDQAIWRYYAPVTDYIKANLGEDKASLFAEPIISNNAVRGIGKAVWSSFYLSKNAKVLTSLPLDKQEYYYALLNQKVKALELFSDQLLNSTNPDDEKVGELIKSALIIPDLNHVLVEKDQIALVAWGFTFVDEVLPFSLKEVLSKMPIVSLEIENNEIIKEFQAEVKQEKEAFPKEEKKTGEYKESDIKTEGRIEVEPKTIRLTDKTIVSLDEPSINNRYRRWWLLLLLLLLLLLYSLFKKRTVDILPTKPNIIIPIDTTKIITDIDSLKKIISNRLNIALIGTNNDIPTFAKAFKNVYPKEAYKIIYYDTFTYRIQIEIPEKELIKVKKELASKLPDFEMIVWYESIFERNRIPKDPGFKDSKKTWQYDVTKIYDAWDVTRGDSNLIIAIIDDGFDLIHPELQGRIYKPWNVITQSPSINIGLNSNHGTHVAGIALASMNNGRGVAGVASDCLFMPIQIGDYNGNLSSTAIIDGILYAIQNGAKIINLSLGLRMDSKVAMMTQDEQVKAIQQYYLEEEQFWTQLFKMAYDKGVSVILAGGNQNILIGLDPMQRSSYTINVSAINPNLEKANFSNYGPYSTISAPGVQIYSSTPNDSYDFFDGTSMAAPMVAGAVALLRSVNPVLQQNEIVDLLQSTGMKIGDNKKYIGNLMQLGMALNISEKNRNQMPKVDCPEMQAQIDSLLVEIEKIKLLCSNASSTDTLKMPLGTNDFSFALGRWKSTSYIYSGTTGDKITLYFDFNQDGTGQLTLVEPDNTQCIAALSLSLQANKFSMDQLEPATCYPPPSAYNEYYFECEPDKTGCAECWTHNKNDKTNYFKFRLVRIRNLNF